MRRRKISKKRYVKVEYHNKEELKGKKASPSKESDSEGTTKINTLAPPSIQLNNPISN